MALTLATVSGYMTKPDGTVLENGIVTFTLSGVAASDNYILNSQVVSIATNSVGFFTVQLMPNVAYDYPTSYSVVGYEFDLTTNTTKKGYDFGRIRVPTLGGNIENLLPIPNYGIVNTTTVIKGDSIRWQSVWVDDIGLPIDLTAATVTCKFVHSSGVEYTATIDMTGAAMGKFIIKADTVAYLAGQYNVRISVVNAGLTKTSIGTLRVTA